MMRRKTWMSWALSGLIATALITVIYFFFVSKTHENIEKLSLQLARQISAQVSQLAIEGKFRNEKDPISWATQKISAGSEPRLFKVIPARAPSQLKESEVFELNRRTGIFDYFITLENSSGDGIRIFIEAGSVLMGGLKNHWAQDFVLGFVWLTTFLSLSWFFLVRRTKKKNRYLQLELQRRESRSDDRQELASWVRKIQTEIDALERFELVMKRINEYSGWAEKAAQSFLESGYDDPREILWQAQRLHDYLTKLHQVTDRGQNLLSQYHKKIRTSAEWTPRTGTQA